MATDRFSSKGRPREHPGLFGSQKYEVCPGRVWVLLMDAPDRPIARWARRRSNARRTQKWLGPKWLEGKHPKRLEPKKIEARRGHRKKGAGTMGPPGPKGAAACSKEEARPIGSKRLSQTRQEGAGPNCAVSDDSLQCANRPVKRNIDFSSEAQAECFARSPCCGERSPWHGERC